MFIFDKKKIRQDYFFGVEKKEFQVFIRIWAKKRNIKKWLNNNERKKKVPKQQAIITTGKYVNFA